MNAEPPPPSSGTGPRPTLLRSLGLFSAIMLATGGVIGSGIFRKTGGMAAQLGSPELLLLVWVFAGLITLCGALTNAEIAAMIPETGGQYVFFRRMYGPFFAYLYGWALFIVVQCGSIAAVAYVFAEYSSQLLKIPEVSATLADWSFRLPFIGDVMPFRELGAKSIAAGTVVLLTVVNYLGVKFGKAVQNVFSVAKISAMLLLIFGVAVNPSIGSAVHLTTSSVTGVPSGLALFAAIAAALQGAFWAYDGWNKLTFVAGEIQQPQRNIPLALFWGTIAVTTLYVLVNVAYVYVLPIDEMKGSKLVAADVAKRMFAGGDRWIAALVMVSTFGAANAIILTTARVYFSMAQRGSFPRVLGRVHPRFRTPAASLVAQGVWASVLLFSGTFDMLTDRLIFVAWVFYAAGAFGIFVLRRREPKAQRPYRVPGYPWVPAGFVIFALTFLAFTVYNDLTQYRADVAAGKPAMIQTLFAVSLVFVGAPFYFLFRGQKDGESGPEAK